MIARQIGIELEAPTCIAQRPASLGQITTTLGYISGTALRGALAARWLAGRRFRDLTAAEAEEFLDLFLNDRIRFGNGLPRSTDNDRLGPTWIVPQTAWTTKRNGGWTLDGGNGVVDILSRLLRDSVQDRADVDELDRLGDEFAVDGGLGLHYLPVQRRLITRNAVNEFDYNAAFPSRGVVTSGQLYSFEALESKQIFDASITSMDDRTDLLPGVLALGARLTLGKRRSAGDGLARVKSLSNACAPTASDPDTLLESAKEFSERAGAAAGTFYIPVTLESDLILRDRFLLPCSSGEPAETLGRYRPGAPPEMRLHLALQRTRWISGWDMIREIPRTPRLAVVAGSVWVYSVPKEHLPLAIEWWSEVEREGIGELLNQGFGRVRLMHPLHEKAEFPW